MKRFSIGLMIVLLMLTFFTSCNKAPIVEPVKEQPKVEKVAEPETKIAKPELTPEQLFQRKSLEEANRMGYLKKINFDFDKYLIREDMKPVLQQNADWMLKYGTVEISIAGHCDERGTIEYNMALGEKRAAAAKKYMVSLGVAEGKINIVSYGKSNPMVKGVDDDSHAQNRRDEFIITKK
ncbi:MAG: OmpA family protein [bacterium]|nr:OmpA family protein [bacterium]